MIKCNDDSVNHGGTQVSARIGALIIALVLAWGCLAGTPMPAMADDAGAAQAGDGRIDISYVDDDEPIAGAHLTVYRVAEWSKSGGYAPTGKFSGYADSIDWAGLLNADSETFRVVAQTLAAYAQRDGINADDEAVTDQNGDAAFAGLAKGLYLVSVARYTGITDAGDNIACDASALLVSLPAFEDSATDGGSSQTMHVTLAPKTECETTPQPSMTELTARKVWKNDSTQASGVSSDRPKSITVQLLRDGTVFATARLDESNHWQYRWTGLEAGHDWRVVEASVPARYVVTLDREGNEVVITNTHVTPPDTGANISTMVILAVAVAIAAIGLFACVVIGRRLQRD